MTVRSLDVLRGIMCLKCRDVKVSRTRHDFRSCECGAVFVDGGQDYIRTGGDLGNFDYVDVRKHGEPPDAEIAGLRAQVTQLTSENELLRDHISDLEDA